GSCQPHPRGLQRVQSHELHRGEQYLRPGQLSREPAADVWFVSTGSGATSAPAGGPGDVLSSLDSAPPVQQLVECARARLVCVVLEEIDHMTTAGVILRMPQHRRTGSWSRERYI